jgi:predicted negative regulator of RcsB-dependent stress response
MAQATRTTAPTAAHTTAGLSDDPLENATDWANANRKPIIILVSVIAAVALLIFLYRTMDASKREKASAALYQAQAPMASGNTKDAEPALERVVKNFGGTSAAQQAALLLAQIRYDGGKHAEGIAGLENALGSAGEDFKASFEQMIAMGYEAQGKRDEAAAHYAKAADAARFDGEKTSYQAARARQLMAAGKPAEAKPIWEELLNREDPTWAREAAIRLGEISGATISK